MKITIINCDCKVVVKKPDDKFQEHLKHRLTGAMWQEIIEFMEEVKVTLRKLQPGETAQLESKPLRVELSREPETETGCK